MSTLINPLSPCLPIDATPTPGSTNAVSSGGTAEAINAVFSQAKTVSGSWTFTTVPTVTSTIRFGGGDWPTSAPGVIGFGAEGASRWFVIGLSSYFSFRAFYRGKGVGVDFADIYGLARTGDTLILGEVSNNTVTRYNFGKKTLPTTLRGTQLQLRVTDASDLTSANDTVLTLDAAKLQKLIDLLA